MSAFAPQGTLSLGAALARIAEGADPSAWAQAKPDVRSFLCDGYEPRGLQSRLWTGGDSVAGRAYAEIRPLLASAVLPAVLRMRVGAPRPIEPQSWTAQAADRLIDVLRGRASFTIAGGEVAEGEVFVRVADLDAALRGERPAGMPADAVQRSTPEPTRARGGNRPNPEVDRFWIEVCRLVHSAEVKGGQAGLTEQMAQWASDNMDRPYDAETIRKKVRALFKAIDWD